MVMSSNQIAQMNGAFQGAAMGQMVHAGMVGSAARPFTGESVTGGAMNVAGAVGGPLAMGGLALAGLDPFSMALRGATAGFGAGGVGGAIAGGVGGAALMGAPLMAASYGVGQVFEGAQQQQALNASLRQNYGFRNQYGGTGFTQAGMGQIGQTMRSMTSQVGPGGEMVGFEELGRLAQNMGRMGMAQGVRDAKQFTERFREMVSTLKDIASEMGTSLEEAQKMMAGMKASGVFRLGDAKRFSSMIRSGAQAGGLATSELTGMMQVGSQISRMIGGRGAAGAQGGIETLTNIGVAQQMGVLSEEDIYNATGETGAMGRRILATQQMQGAARFLKSGLGRRMVAAMAGANGQLDEESVQEVMSGGVTTGRTMQMAHRNLRGVGRANFIRNEGRLRGEILRRFGGTIQAQSLRGWLEGKGVDVDVDQDRAMLFMQRRLRMGRDEADVMMKQIQALPEIMRERKISGQEEEFARGMETRRRHMGIEGYKRKFEEARAAVQSGLQKVGSEWYQDMSNMVDRFINKVTGQYVEEFNRDVGRTFDRALGGGAVGRAAMEELGLGRGTLAGGLTAGAGGGAGGAARFVQQFANLDAARFREAGFDVGVGEELTLEQRTFAGRTREAMMGKLSEARSISRIMSGAGKKMGIGGGLKLALREAYASNRIKGRGMDRMASVEKFLEAEAGRGDKEAARVLEQLKGADPEERARIVAGLNDEAGQKGEAQMYALPNRMSEFSTSKFATVTDQADAIGKAILGDRDTDGAAMQAAKSLLNNTLSMFGIDAQVTPEVAEGAKRAMGTFFLSKEGRSLTARAFSRDAGVREKTYEALIDDLGSLQRQQTLGRLDDAGQGELEAKRALAATVAFNNAGGDKATERDLQAIARKLNLPGGAAEVRRLAKVGAELQTEREEANIVQLAKQFGEPAQKRVDRMREMGVLTKGERGLELSAMATIEAAEAVGGGTGGQAAIDFVRGMAASDVALGQAADAATPADMARLLTQGQEERARAISAGAGMSVAQKRQLARELGGERGRILSGQASLEAGVRRGGRTAGGRLGRAVEMLGGDLSRKDINKLLTEGGGGGQARATRAILADLGLEEGSDAIQSQVADIVRAASQGKTGEMAVGMQQIMGTEEFEEARKKRALQKDEQANPLQTQIRDSMKTLADAYGGQGFMASTQRSMANSLTRIEEKLAGDPEKVPEGS